MDGTNVMIDSYPQVFNLGHKAIVDLLKDPVVVQEKVDGSQFSFGLMHLGGWEGAHTAHELKMRSKGCKVTPENAGMFKLAVEAVAKRVHLLTPGFIYRGEFLAKPKHNALAYDRTPKDYIILYDIQRGAGDFLSPVEMELEANRIELETVPFYSVNMDPQNMSLENCMTWLKSLLDVTSILGGQKVEGVTIKNYTRFGFDAKPLFGKYVSEKFKEVHAKEWKIEHPHGGDILDILTARYRSEARWMKAVQHLRERGELEDSPRDIGKLFKEVPTDLLKECKDEIMTILFDWAWKRKLSRSITAGLAEWYKELLAAQQFIATDHKCNPTIYPDCCYPDHVEHGGEGGA